MLHPLDCGGEVLRFYRDFIKTIPDDLTTAAALLTSPDGHKMAAMAVAHCGSLEQGARAVRPVKEFGVPALDAIGPLPYIAQQALFKDGFPRGLLNYWKADIIREWSDSYIDAAVNHYREAPSPRAVMLWFPLSGRVARVAPDATAYPHRTGIHAGVYSLWTDRADDQQNIVWARDGWKIMQPVSAGGVYVNELGLDESDDRVRGAYGMNYGRLARLKAQYDPTICSGSTPIFRPLRETCSDRRRHRRRVMIAAVLVGCVVDKPENEVRFLLIVTERLRPGIEGAYNENELELARACATLQCPHPYLALASVAGPREVWWLNAFTSREEKDGLDASYASNEPLMAALRRLGKRKEGFREALTSTMTEFRRDLSGDSVLRIAGARFFVIQIAQDGGAAAGAVFQAADGTRFVIVSANNRTEAEHLAERFGTSARILAVQPQWSFPADAWVDADPEFWRARR